LLVSDQDIATFEAEAREQQIDWITIKYGEADHAFTTFGSSLYNEKIDKRAHQFTMDFFEERFSA